MEKDASLTEHSRTLSGRDDERTVQDLAIPGQKLLWKGTQKPPDTNLVRYSVARSNTLVASARIIILLII